MIKTGTTDISSWWDNPTTQMWLVDRPLHIVLTLVVALALHWASKRLVDKFAQHAIDSPPRLPSFGPTRQQEKAVTATVDVRREARIRTLAGVFKSAVNIVIWLWVLIDVLATIGINVAPLIASAGVVGVALGFGAQSLVKDFLSGVFMLLEDQYGVGDVIDVGKISGTVEDVSLRLTTIRDLDGTVWFVRNGEILRIGNFSQGYAFARIDIPIGLDNDVETAKQEIMAATERAAALEDIAPLLQAEPVMDGVAKVDVDYLTIRVRVKTEPGQQWHVQRTMYEHIVSNLHTAGIKPAFTLRNSQPQPNE
ncbi:mechanosensitive ion channel family protein [Corynebacterium epidermidicanis]|nr:mechanosensitive ion channel family protein [Corynebacterium epidermidicanis]